MPITLGFYDLFSYLIPGVLYLYLLNEFFKLFDTSLGDLLPSLSNASTLQDAVFIALSLVSAFIVGHIFDMLARWFVFRLIFRKKTSQKILDEIKVRDSAANVQFEAKDWHLLLILLRQRNLEVAHSFDKHEADSIMFRNISLIALLTSFLMAIKAILENPAFWILCVVALVICAMSARRSLTLHSWFFDGIFLASLEYGNTVKKVITYNQRQRHSESAPIPTPRKNKEKNKRAKPSKSP